MNNVNKREGQQFLIGKAQFAFPRRVQIFEVAVEPSDTDQIAREREDAITLLFCPLALGNVRHCADVAVGLAIPREESRRAGIYPANVPLLVLEAEFARELNAVTH